MLRPDEKVAGRAFRDEEEFLLLRYNQEQPPSFVVPVFIGVYRHNCAGRGGRSTELALTERYVLSPAFEVVDIGNQRVARHIVEGSHPEGSVIVPEGRFAFLYREGTCRSCGLTARSESGRLIEAEERPPIHGWATRSGADHGGHQEVDGAREHLGRQHAGQGELDGQERRAGS